MGHASWVSGQRGIGMCRHLYFRNDFDLAGIRIGNNLFHILLCKIRLWVSVHSV